MKKINVLEKHIAQLIAAGEVVERPSSVIKELVENSIDAGATAISVEIKNGGVAMMKVSDNGCGIDRSEVPKAFLRHATSKIAKKEDLDSIATLGFRGEALASIAAVARVELFTRVEQDLAGTHYVIEAGEEKLLEDTGCARGSTIIVSDLFFNVPARMKFLKKDSTEGNSIAALLDRIALSHPEVAFRFVKNGREDLSTPGNSDMMSCICAVYGKNFCEELFAVDYNLGGVRVSGFVSLPKAARASRSMQHFFVNGRYVKSKTAMAALEQAMKGTVMVGKFPACVLYLELPCEVTDVNVHPTKMEIRFIDERPIFDAVYYGVKSALNNREQKVFAPVQKSFSAARETAEQLAFAKTPREKDISSNNLKSAREDRIFAEAKKGDKPLPQAQLSAKAPDKRPAEDDFFPEIQIPKKSTFSPISSPRTKKGIVDSTAKISTETLIDNIFDDEALPAEKVPQQFDIPRVSLSDASAGMDPFENPAPDADKEDTIAKIDKIFYPDEKPAPAENKSSEKTESQTLNDAPRESLNEPPKALPLIEEWETAQKREPRFIGELFANYILLEDGDELLLVDKHAAHERLVYERLKKEKENVSSQLLLEPVQVLLEKNHYGAILENLPALERAGFEVDDFGTGVIIVRAAPTYLPREDIKTSVEEMAKYILQNKKLLETSFTEWLYHNISCRAAIKAGQKSDKAELLALLEELKKNPDAKYCVHGRPITIKIHKKDIEKRFGRL